MRSYPQFTLGKSEIETLFLVTLSLALYSAVQSGEDEFATMLVIILTAISLAVIYLTTKISRTD